MDLDDVVAKSRQVQRAEDERKRSIQGRAQGWESEIRQLFTDFRRKMSEAGNRGLETFAVEQSGWHRLAPKRIEGWRVPESRHVIGVDGRIYYGRNLGSRNQAVELGRDLTATAWDPVLRQENPAHDVAVRLASILIAYEVA